MKFVVLSDNKPLPGNDLVLPEHGFSLYFELKGRRFLYDTGASGKFIQNAAQFGIDIKCVDVVIISHGHNDHTGGLRELFRINKSAKVYLSSEILFNDYYTCRRGPKRMLSMDKSLFNEFYDRFVFLNDDTEIFPGITLFFTKDALFSMPVANKFLFVTKDGVDYNDNFSHEMSVLINGDKCSDNMSIDNFQVKSSKLRIDEFSETRGISTSDGDVVLSACSHMGILNILNKASSFSAKIKTFIGGLHLVEGEFDSDKEIADIGKTLKREYPQIHLYTGHCTSDRAIQILKHLQE